jgi:HEAT repeat protein
MQPEPKISESKANSAKARRVQTDVRALISLVVCCGVVFWATRYLWESRHPAVAAARGLRASSASARVRAVRELMELGAGDSGIAISPLIIALADTEAAVRIEAAKALGMFGSEAMKNGVDDHQVRAAVAALCGSLQDRQPEVRSAAANALAEIVRCDRAEVLDLGPAAAKLVAMLNDRNAEVHRAVVGAIGFIGPRVLVDPPLAIVAALDDESAQKRSDAVDALANFKSGLPRLIPSLLRSMERAQPDARASYARLLGKIQPPNFSAQAIRPLVADLESHDPEIRHLAVSRLAAFKRDAREAVPAMIELFRNPIDLDPSAAKDTSRNRMLRVMPFAAARALCQIAPGTDQAAQVISTFSEAMRSGRPDCQIAAAECLGSFGPDAQPAIPLLIEALLKPIVIEKPNSEWNTAVLVADWSARSLGKIAPGTPSADVALAALTEALWSESLGTPHIAIMMALSEFGPKSRSAIPRLRQLQKDPEQRVRDIASYALKRLEP